MCKLYILPLTFHLNLSKICIFWLKYFVLKLGRIKILWDWAFSWLLFMFAELYLEFNRISGSVPPQTERWRNMRQYGTMALFVCFDISFLLHCIFNYPNVILLACAIITWPLTAHGANFIGLGLYMYIDFISRGNILNN